MIGGISEISELPVIAKFDTKILLLASLFQTQVAWGTWIYSIHQWSVESEGSKHAARLPMLLQGAIGGVSRSFWQRRSTSPAVSRFELFITAPF